MHPLGCRSESMVEESESAVSAAGRSTPSHKERLIAAGIRMLYAKGYHGTTVDALLEDAGVPKGSFYHHFGSKESFGLAVLQRYEDIQRELLRRWSGRHDLSVPERLAAYHRDVVGKFLSSEWQLACLAGKLSNELAANSEPFRARLSTTFVHWGSALEELLAEGQRSGEVRADQPAGRLADAVIAMIEGGFVGALSLRQSEDFTAVTVGLGDLVKARL
jgi:TetR/AcrR family transcriptional repressor of nem operon